MDHVWSRRDFLHRSGTFSGAVLLVHSAPAWAQQAVPAGQPSSAQTPATPAPPPGAQTPAGQTPAVPAPGTPPATGGPATPAAAPPATPRPRPAPLAGDLVQQFVVAAHRDLAATRQMLDEQPGLLNASWDWGGGDFELAIGGAGHMGRRDIADLLLGRGARMDLFVAAMLGRLDIVKGTLTAYPTLLESRGPHGFTLLHHARVGGEPAAEVLRYLQSLGARDGSK